MRSLPTLLVSLKNMRKPSTSPPNSPRANGLSCPPHPYQLFVWLALIFVQLGYLGAVAPALPETLSLMVYTSNLALMIVHLSTHIWCLILNPADLNVLKNWGSKTNAASFDRTQHRHVIEDQFCHICNVYVGKHTKHCSRCNKCVSDFDHHCKWLNTCIGGRNYISFLLCLASAWIGCLFIALVATTAPTMYFVDRSWLRPFQTSSQNNPGSSTTSISWDGNLTTPLTSSSNTTASNELSLPTGAAPSFTFFAPVSDVTWLTVAILTAGLAALATALLGHLLFFHIYLVCQGLSTYQLVIRQRELEANAKTTSMVPLTPPPPPQPSSSSSCLGRCACPAKDKGKPPKNQVSPAMLHNTRITSAQSSHMGPTTEILSEGYSPSPTHSRTNSTHPGTSPQMLTKSVLLMERIKGGNGPVVVQNVQSITNGTATTVFSTSPQHSANNPLASPHPQSVQHSPSIPESRRRSSLGNSKQALTEERMDTSTGYISPSFIDSPSLQRQKSVSPNFEEQNGGLSDANLRHYCWQDRDTQSLHSMETACSPKRRIISVNSSRPSLKSNDEEQGERLNDNPEDISEEKKDKQNKWAYQSEVPRTNSVVNPVWRWSMDQSRRPTRENSLPDTVITRWSFPSNQSQNPTPVQTHERWTPLLKIGPNAMAFDQQLREEVLL